LLVWISQPLLPTLSQLVNPLAHVGEHAPALHVVDDVPAVLHTKPHVPQLLVSTCVCVSQPSSCLFALQSDQPALHAPVHAPPEHAAVTWVDEHEIPQPPHDPALVFVFVSQPFAYVPSQSLKPDAHAAMMQPALPPTSEHAGFAFDAAGHAAVFEHVVSAGGVKVT
jgi:hypothetical protein